MQPGGQRGPATDGTGMLRQGQEGGLRGVLRVLMMVKGTTANPKDEAGAAPHNGDESLLVAVVDKGPQQLGVAALFAGELKKRQRAGTGGATSG